jgi:hypothetical protein
LTGSDEDEQEKAIALASGPPSTTHLLPADSGD